MRAPIFQVYILATLVALGICIPTVDEVASSPKAASGAMDVPLAKPASTSAVKQTIALANPGNATATAGTKAKALETRQQTDYYLCTAGAIPYLPYCVDTLDYIDALNEVITLEANYCIWWETGDCVAYFCATPCGGISFGTTWLAGILTDVYDICYDDYGANGLIYTNYSPYWEAGFELGGDVVPQYAYCT